MFFPSKLYITSRFAEVNSVIKQFNEKCNRNTQDDYIIPLDFFDVPKPLVLAEIPYCQRNETLSKRFIKKFHEFYQQIIRN